MSTLTIQKQHNALDLFLRTARETGNPREQIENLARGGYCPQPKQLAFHTAARLADEPDGPTQVAQGGARGGAKSHAAVCQMALDDCVRRPGLKWLYLRSVGASARESFEDLLGKALPHLMNCYVVSKSRIELPNGSRTILGGFRNERDIDKYVGLEYDGIIIDDAHLISAGKHAKIRGSLRTSKPDWRPRLYLTFNPGGIGHAYLKAVFVEPWRNGDERDTRFVFSMPEDNAFINKEYADYLDGLTGWLKRAWRYGDFDISAGQFFTTWSHKRHVVEPFEIPRNWRVWLAMDYGFTHWNVVHLLAEDNDGVVYVVDEHAERRWLVRQHAAAVRAMLQRHNLAPYQLWKFVTGADCFAKQGTDGLSVADQWQASGFTLEAANMDRVNGAAECLSRLGDIGAGIEPTCFIFSRCARLIECIPSLEHDPHRPEDVLKVGTDEDGRGGDDAYDTWRYGLMARVREYGPPGVSHYA